MSCRLNMRDTENGRTADITSLIYGKIFSHRSGTSLKTLDFGFLDKSI